MIDRPPNADSRPPLRLAAPNDLRRDPAAPQPLQHLVARAAGAVVGRRRTAFHRRGFRRQDRPARRARSILSARDAAERRSLIRTPSAGSQAGLTHVWGCDGFPAARADAGPRRTRTPDRGPVCGCRSYRVPRPLSRRRDSGSFRIPVRIVLDVPWGNALHEWHPAPTRRRRPSWWR